MGARPHRSSCLLFVVAFSHQTGCWVAAIEAGWPAGLKYVLPGPLQKQLTGSRMRPVSTGRKCGVLSTSVRAKREQTGK